MLRGSARHDGIPNKQSGKDPDRDRQREQQRKERAQMLPDDKEIHAGSQDLFNAPVKVKPSIEDTTSLQIRKSLGNFEPIRHLMEHPFPTQPQQPFIAGGERGYLSSTSTPSLRNPSQSVDPAQSRPAASSSSSAPNSFPTDSNSSTKSHYSRNLYHGNHHSTGVSNNIIPTSSTSNPGPIGPSTSNFRASNQNHLIPPISKVPHNQPQLPHNSAIFNSNSNQISTVPIVPIPGPILNQSPNLISSDNNQVKFKPIPTFGLNEQSASVDVKLDGGGLTTETFSSTVFNNELFLNSNNSVRDAKCNKNVFPNKKAAPERADSQLELESILKEMTDVIPPLTAIQTPVKEINKKLPPRRSSKSEEKIVQSIIDSGMAKIPSPVPRMESSGESSSSYETDSDSESEDSSSASHAEGDKSDTLGSSNMAPNTGSPTTKWDLSSFLKTAKDPPIIGKPISKSPKDVKFNSFSSLDSEPPADDIVPVSLDRLDNVTSTVTNKSQSPPGPIENASTSSALETRAKLAARTTRGASNSRPEPHIPPKPTPSIIPSKVPTTTTQSKVSSLSASSSEDEAVEPPAKQPKRKVTTKPTTPVLEKPSTSGASANKRSRTTGQTTASVGRHVTTNVTDGESSPETKSTRNAKNGQDKNKTDTIRKLFRFGTNKPGGKVQSPNLETESSAAKSTPPGTSKQASNRVSAKGNPSVAHNGDLGSASANASDKKKEGSKEKTSSQSQAKKHQKLSGNALAKSLLTSPETASTVPCPPPPVRVVKEEMMKNMSSASSLIVRIPLDKLRRKPPLANSFPALAPIVSPSLSKTEKELEKANKKLAASISNDAYRVPKLSQNSSRVGSSSDPTVIQPFPLHDSGIANDRDDSLCSDSGRPSPTNHSSKKRPKKRSRASPKKTKIKREPPDSHTKLEVDFDGEVSSANLLGYAPCDSITRTPPIDPDVVQAPDSSLNPPHLPSPIIQPQLQYLSYFEKTTDVKDDLFSRDQDSYLEEAKKLKHSADNERTSTTQASMYLEAGLYFILTGIIMERDGTGNNAPYTMYRDTLTLIQYIGNRWRSAARSAGPEGLQNQEAKIITLSMRCQALLFCKLFKMKMKETRDMVSNMHEYFTKNVVREPLVVTNSPQLSTPSPHSPTSSPAGSSGVLHTPSPHHQQNHLLPIPRNLYNQIQKHCGNTFNCIMAHDTWEQADAYVTRYRLEEFFIGMDRHLGPLTLHSTLVDLVRYVRYGLQLINGSLGS